MCGCRTWGKLPENVLGANLKPTEKAPFEAEGFKRFDLPELSKHQICKNDNFYGVGWSKVVSFRKV